MRARTLILSLSLIGVLSSTACVIVVNDEEADAEWIGSYETDSDARNAANNDLRDRVGQRLAEVAQLRDEDISVAASNGVVTLRGKVGDPAVVQRAVDRDGCRRRCTPGGRKADGRGPTRLIGAQVDPGRRFRGRLSAVFRSDPIARTCRHAVQVQSTVSPLAVSGVVGRRRVCPGAAA